MTGTATGNKMWSPVYTLREVPFTRREEFGHFKAAASVTLMCAYADRYNAAADLIQHFREYPYNPEVGLELYCTSANVRTPTSECWDVDNQEQVCDYAETAYIDASYELVYTVFTSAKGKIEKANDPTTGDEVTITETLTDMSEFMTIKSRALNWNTSGKLVPDDVPQTKFNKRLVLERSEDGLTAVSADLLTLSGKCNQADYVSSIIGTTFKAETLLFAGASVTYNVLSSRYSLNFKLMIKNDGSAASPKGWNYFWDADAQIWDMMKKQDGTVVKPYEPDDFSWLLF